MSDAAPAERSGPLAAWTRAWFQGRVSLDEVIDAVTGADAPHQVAGLSGVVGSDGFGAEPEPLRELLVTWRRSGAPTRLVLPVAGDVRGLWGPAQFRGAALEAGSAVVGAAVGVVPEVIEYFPSSAPPTVLWAATRLDSIPADSVSPDYVPLADAQYELTTAIRECAGVLGAAEVAGASGAVAEALRDARRAGEHVNLPAGHPPRAVALLAQAQRLSAVLELALADPAGGAIDQHGMVTRSAALRPLATAVRRAMVAAYNAD